MMGKPIKRNENIAPLSKEHHSGLLFCWKITQGVKHNIEAARIVRYIRYFWETHLKQHFNDEENILFNRLNNELCTTALAQHEAIRSLVSRINESATGSAEICAELASEVDGHIRFEERTLFPFLESALTAAALAEIGVQLKKAHILCSADNYDDEFWLMQKKV